MNIWLKSLIAGVAAAALTFIIRQQSGRQNKKPLYTIYYTIEVTPDENTGQEEYEEVMVKLTQTLKRRCEASGYSAYRGIADDADQLQITVEHVDDTLQSAYLMTRSNRLEFRELYMLTGLYNSFISMSAAAEKFFPEIAGKDSTNVFNHKNISSLIFFNTTQSGGIFDKGMIGKVLKKDTALINKILSDTEVLNSFPRDVEFLYGPVENIAGAKDKLTFLNVYATKTKMQKAPLQNIDIVHAGADKGFNGQPEVVFQFSDAASRIWESMTGENRGSYIAIILDKKVISAPHVNEAIHGGSCSISGGFTQEEAELLAQQLNAGFIPVNLSIIEQSISLEKRSPNGKTLLISALIFLLITGLSFLILNRLSGK